MKIVFIGSGNVATHLSIALHKQGLLVSQVYSRTPANAEALATKLNCAFCSSIADICLDADLYFYALKDSAFYDFIKLFQLPPSAIHVHTAGSVPLDVFSGKARRFGVFYPLQTFSKSKELDFSLIPVCVEASDDDVKQSLLDLAGKITNHVCQINSNQRRSLHIAAVFACNFSNYMYDVAAQLLEQDEISFDIIRPLITETAEKLKTLTPFQAQTGPAIRYDQNIIGKHIEMLENNPEFHQIYRLLSSGIHHRHQSNK